MTPRVVGITLFASMAAGSVAAVLLQVHVPRIDPNLNAVMATGTGLLAIIIGGLALIRQPGRLGLVFVGLLFGFGGPMFAAGLTELITLVHGPFAPWIRELIGDVLLLALYFWGRTQAVHGQP